MKLANRNSKEKKVKADDRSVFARHMLISVGVGLVLLAALLCAGAIIALRMDIARSHMAFVAIPLAGLAAVVTGYVYVRPKRAQGLLFGALAGAALYLPLLAAGVVISRAAPGTNAIILLPVMLLCGAIGGIVAANRGGATRKSVKSRKRT